MASVNVYVPDETKAEMAGYPELSWSAIAQGAFEEAMSGSTIANSPDPTKYSNSRWEKLIASTFEHIQFLAKTKGEEYSGTIDRLANFRRYALALGLTKEQILMVYAGKHWDSITTFVKEQADTSGALMRTLSEPISGRVDDLIVYLLLFKAMLEENGQ